MYAYDKTKSKGKKGYSRWDFDDYCEVKFRVIKFKIKSKSKDKWEVLVTNLNRFEFPTFDVKQLYFMRWGIETSFCELKYAVGAIRFHSKKDKFVAQELLAHLIIYNATARAAGMLPIIRNGTKYSYAVNFKMAVLVFRRYYRHFNSVTMKEMLEDMEFYRQPVRKGRHGKYKTKKNKIPSAIPFVYRVA